MHYPSSYSFALGPVEQFSRTWTKATRNTGVPSVFPAPLPAVQKRVVAFAPFIEGMGLRQLELVVAPPIQPTPLQHLGDHGSIHEFEFQGVGGGCVSSPFPASRSRSIHRDRGALGDDRVQHSADLAHLIAAGSKHLGRLFQEHLGVGILVLQPPMTGAGRWSRSRSPVAKCRSQSRSGCSCPRSGRATGGKASSYAITLGEDLHRVAIVLDMF